MAVPASPADPAGGLPVADLERLSGAGHWEWQVGEDVVTWSPRLFDIFGVAPGDAPRSFASYLELLPDDERAGFTRTIAQVLRDRVPFSFEHEVLTGNGERRTVSTRGDLAFESNGRVTRVFGVTRDVTELRQAVRGLQESETRFRHIAEHLGTGLWLFDTESQRYLYVNPAYTRITGQSQAELERDPQSWFAYIHSDDLPDVARTLDEDVRAGYPGYTCEHRVVRPNDEVRWVQVRSAPVPENDGRALRIVGSMEDVTELRAVQDALTDSENRFRRLAEGLPHILWVGDLRTGMTEYLNPAYERIVGRTADEIYRDSRAWLGYVHPDDVARMKSVVENLTLEVSRHEFRFVRPDGETRWLRWVSYSLRDDDGRPSRRVALAEDVTTQRRLADELVHAQKMEAVGRLAGGVAHDFNNLLFVILNHLDDAMADLPEQSSVRADIRSAKEAADRVSTLTDQLLAFSRRRPTATRDVDLGHAVAEVTDLLGRTLGTDVALTVELPEDLPLVRMDPTQLQQVVINLAVNARDAMPRGGTLAITGSAAPDVLTAGGTAVRLEFGDNGEGMTPEVTAHAFEPFFTTKPVGEGTGLGLSTVYGIVEEYGGHVLLDSTPGTGTTVTVLLPALVSARRPETGDATPSRVDGTGKVVLVVEDDDDVRMAIRRQLRSAGFTVHETSRPVDAIARCQHSVWRVDLLVTDVVMPGMSGGELVDRLGELGLFPPVIFVSGYPSGTGPQDMDGPRSRFLAKPFRSDQLLEATRELAVGVPAEPFGPD